MGPALDQRGNKFTVVIAGYGRMTERIAVVVLARPTALLYTL